MGAAKFSGLVGPKGGLGAEVAGGVAGGLVLTVTNLVLRLASGVLLARVLGADGVGAFAFAFSVVALMQIPTELGLPQLVTREVAALREQGQWGLLRGLLSRAFQAVGLLGVVVASVGAVVGLVLLWNGGSPRLSAFLVALLLLPIVALSSLRLATLSGLRHVVLGQMPELLIRPGLVAVALAGGYLVLGSGFLGPTEAMWLHVGAAAVGFAVGSYLLARRLPVELREHRPAYQSRQWLRYAVPFMLLAGLSVVNSRVTIVLLGVFRANADVGIYQVCLTAAAPVAFGLVAANTAVAPHVARLWATRELALIQKVVSGAARIGLAVALVLTAVIVLFGGFLLTLFFGDEFRVGSMTLTLIAIGQLVNTAFGPVGLILNMTGHAKLAVRGFVAALVGGVILNLVLIPRMGIEGAAISAIAAFLIWNSVLFAYVRREVGVISLAFGGKRWGPTAASRDDPGGAQE